MDGENFLLLVWLLISIVLVPCFSLNTTINFSYLNTSKLLAGLLTDYDIRLRPGFGGAKGDALVLTMDIIIASFDSMSEVNMDYTLTIYLHQYWQDERLSWSNEHNVDDMTLSGDFSTNIWLPDTFLANDKSSFLHDVTETNKMLRLHSDGRISYGMRFTSTLACHMDLHNYPLDAQNCTIEIESYGYTIGEVLMRWNTPDPVKGVREADIPQFSIIGFHTEDRVVETATGAYQRLSLVFLLRRNIGYFIFQTYLPCILIVMLSWVSFWINHEATSARVALGITTVLTMTTISTGVRQSLPRISYVMCFLFVFAALLEYAAVNYSYWGGKTSEREQLKHVNPTDLEMFPVIGDDLEGVIKLTRDLRLNPRAQKSEREVRFEGADEPTKSTEFRPPSPLPFFMEHSSNHSKRLVSYLDAGDFHVQFPDYPRVRSTYGISSLKSHLRLRGPNAKKKWRKSAPENRTGFRESKFMNSMRNIRKKAKAVIPRIKDVNVIDRRSRVVFPTSFVLFNAFYWIYYTLHQ